MADTPVEKFDLVVIGTGPGGEKAAAQAAYFGKRVAIVERAPEPGGAGVHTGTLPSKTLRETAMYLSGHQARQLYGVAVKLDRTAELEHLMARKDVIAVSESARIRANLLRHGVTYLHGEGRFDDPHTVIVKSAGEERRVEGRVRSHRDGIAPASSEGHRLRGRPHPRLGRDPRHQLPPRQARGPRRRGHRLRVRLHVRRARHEGRAGRHARPAPPVPRRGDRGAIARVNARTRNRAPARREVVEGRRGAATTSR